MNDISTTNNSGDNDPAPAWAEAHPGEPNS